MPTVTDRLFVTAQALPEPLLVEVLDFDEFLRARQASFNRPSRGFSLSSLCEGLGDSKTFAGSSLEIQQRLRDEWH